MGVKFNKKTSNKGKVNYDPTAMKLVIIASLIIILSIGLIGSLSYFITKNEVVKKVKEKDLTFIAELVSTKIEARINRAIETSSILAHDPEVIGWLEEGEVDKLKEKNVIQKLNVIANEFDYSNAFLASSSTGHYWTEVGLLDQLSNLIM